MNANQSLREIQSQDGTWFLFRGSCTCWHGSLCCVNQHLVVRQLIGITHLANKWRHKNLQTSEVTQWHEQSTRVTFRLSTGEGTRPLTITGRWPWTITNTCQSSSAAPSHLGGGNHQEKQEIHSHNDPQVSLDAIPQVNTLGITPNLTMMMNQWWRWVGGVCLGLHGCITCENV
jgi:hypothetical protein